MNNPQSLLKQLKEQSVAKISPLYCNTLLDKWNAIFDGILNKQHTPRKYVTATNFLENDILLDIFSLKMQSLIFSLMPNAELYHCHAYEIEKEQLKPHIMGGNRLNGWHRDVDCKHNFSKKNVQHISLFIYLSEVNDNSGCFEVSSKKISYLPQFGNTDTLYRLTGEKGTTFLFDRKSYHRASPNISSKPRRVLKLSFQSKDLYNHKRLLKSFSVVKENLKPQELFIRQLFGDKTVNKEELDTFTNKHLTPKQLNYLTLPLLSFPANFSLIENFRRYIRDTLFIARRVNRKLQPSLDSIPPKKAMKQLMLENNK